MPLPCRPPTTGSPFAPIAPRHLYSLFALTPSNESGAATFHAQAYIPTQPAQAIQEARLSHAHKDPRRQEGDFPPPRPGPQTRLGDTRVPRLALCSVDTLVRARTSAV